MQKQIKQSGARTATVKPQNLKMVTSFFVFTAEENGHVQATTKEDGVMSTENNDYSHPDTSDAKSDDEASDLYVLREYPGKFNGKNNDVILAGRYGFLAGIAHSRKSQAAEVAMMRELLERAHKIVLNSKHVDEMTYEKTFNGEDNWLSDFERLKKEMG